MSNAGSDFVGMVNHLLYQVRELWVDKILASRKIPVEVFGEPVRSASPVGEPTNRLSALGGGVTQ